MDCQHRSTLDLRFSTGCRPWTVELRHERQSFLGRLLRLGLDVGHLLANLRFVVGGVARAAAAVEAGYRSSVAALLIPSPRGHDRLGRWQPVWASSAGGGDWIRSSDFISIIASVSLSAISLVMGLAFRARIDPCPATTSTTQTPTSTPRVTSRLPRRIAHRTTRRDRQFRPSSRPSTEAFHSCPAGGSAALPSERSFYGGHGLARGMARMESNRFTSVCGGLVAGWLVLSPILFWRLLDSDEPDVWWLPVLLEVVFWLLATSPVPDALIGAGIGNLYGHRWRGALIGFRSTGFRLSFRPVLAGLTLITRRLVKNRPTHLSTTTHDGSRLQRFREMPKIDR